MAAAGIEQALHLIRGNRYGKTACVAGWIYPAHIDHRFIDVRLRPQPILRRPRPRLTAPEDGDPDRAAAEHLARLEALGDPARAVAALGELVRLDTPALTEDSFAGLSAAQCTRGLEAFFTGDRWNVVIIGAGPIGLALASALRVALPHRVNVLVIESRLSAPHRKVPYERRWITAVAHEIVEGITEETVSRILHTVGDEKYIGVPIDALESLLLLSCRRLGVKLLFAEDLDLSFIGELPVDLVVDASGNRLRPPPWPTAPAEVQLVESLDADRLLLDFEVVSGYGVRLPPRSYHRYVTVGRAGDLWFPICDQRIIKQALLKVYGIPARLRELLLGYIVRHNADNKYYLWPGHMNAAANELLLLVNLERAEHDRLCAGHVFPLAVSDASGLEVDARTAAILALIAEHAAPAEHADMAIDAPFLFRPYLVDPAAPEQLFGKPVIRVGDSVYNGNVKTANGLGNHLQYVRFIQETIWQSASTAQLGVIRRAMGLRR